jgi:tetratricopeptide (TPR) repeat protein
MTSGERLLLRGDYRAAVSRLRKEAARDRQDDFKSGAIQQVGISLLLMQRYSQAGAHFQSLIPQAWKSISTHYVWWGAAEWFIGNHKAAIPIWEKGGKCQYQGDFGLDVAALLYYAALRDPRVYSLDDALTRVETVLKRLNPNSYRTWIPQFILGRLPQREFVTRMSVWDGRFPEKWMPYLKSKTEYYLGLQALREGREDAFWEHLRVCAQPGNYVSIPDELVFARLELMQHGENPLPNARGKRKSKAATTGKQTKRGQATRQSSQTEKQSNLFARTDRKSTAARSPASSNSKGAAGAGSSIGQSSSKRNKATLPMTLTPAEVKLSGSIGFDEAVCLAIKERFGQPLGRAEGSGASGKARTSDGLSVIASRNEIEKQWAELQQSLQPAGYRAFWGQVARSPNADETNELVVLKTTDQYEILRLRQTNGANYEVSLTDIISRLKKWEKQCSFDIIGAGADWVAIEFKKLPADICRFTEEMYLFCPDTVEQGAALMNERDHPKEFAAARKLCPKLSPAMQKHLDQKQKQFEALAQMRPEIKALFQKGSGFTTSTDMGIRLLASNLKKTKSRLLWWD